MKRETFGWFSPPLRVLAVLAVVCISNPGKGWADFVGSSSGSSGNLSAEVDFSQAGNVLTVTLKNLDTHVYGNTNNDHLLSSEVLTGVFFSINGVSSLSNPSSASGTLLNNSGNVVADGWAYSMSTLTKTPGGSLGIVSAGYSDPGHANFQGGNGSALDGYDFGIVGSGYTAGNRIGGDTHGQVVVDQTATFTVTLSSSTALTGSDFSKISFQYGTQLSEPNISGGPVTPNFGVVPEPSSLTLLGMGAICSLGYGWRRRRQSA
jgi:hypothetical protein